jgi:K+-transporting ATPase ATPase C chain
VKKNLLTAILMTIVTTVLLGLIYPLVVTGLAQVIFPNQANGSLIKRADGTVIGSSLIGQPFSSPGYFRSRPSAAGVSGYDAGGSSGSNLGPTNQRLIDRVKAEVERVQAENPGTPIPIDLVTTSGSGLDPQISPAAAAFQVRRVARERSMSEDQVRQVVAAHTEGRQFGFLGEPRVNVLELNIDLDNKKPMPRAGAGPAWRRDAPSFFTCIADWHRRWHI